MRREGTVGERYAQALLEAACEAHAEKEVAENLRLLEHLSRSVPELLPFLAHPRIDPEAKERILGDLGEVLHPYVQNLLRLLVRHGRAGLLPEITSAYFQALERAGGPVQVLVRTAQPLSPEIEDKLRARLKEALGREVALQEEVAPELLAGVELVISGQRLDASLRGRLQRLRKVLGG
ncbi:MAG: ATP synthase F1 subunit delta [Candidatus Bipolaricaulaceae bacterium]